MSWYDFKSNIPVCATMTILCFQLFPLFSYNKHDQRVVSLYRWQLSQVNETRVGKNQIENKYGNFEFYPRVVYCKKVYQIEDIMNVTISDDTIEPYMVYKLYLIKEIVSILYFSRSYIVLREIQSGTNIKISKSKTSVSHLTITRQDNGSCRKHKISFCQRLSLYLSMMETPKTSFVNDTCQYKQEKEKRERSE